MRSWGPRGMVWYWHKWENYPTYEIASGHTNIEYYLSNKQMGPRGCLPICPPTCFVEGGIHPSNHLSTPPDTGPHYYDTIKGSCEGPIINPLPDDPQTPLHSGYPFHATTSDVKSGDVKWFKDASNNDWVIWIDAKVKVHAQTVDQIVVGNVTDYLHWETDIAAQFETEHPLGGTNRKRSIRIDPKRSLVVNGYFMFFLSVCDWEIKPGGLVNFSDKDYTGRVNTNKWYYFPCNDDTGEILGYNPYTDTLPNPSSSELTYTVESDDSYKIINYKHYYVMVKLTSGSINLAGKATITEYLEEEKSSKMPMTIAPRFPESGVDWSTMYLKGYGFDVLAKAENVAPDGTYPPCNTAGEWSSSVANADGLPNHLGTLQGEFWWHNYVMPPGPPYIPCEHGSYWAHWVAGEPGFSDPGFMTIYWWDVEIWPNKMTFNIRPSIQETLNIAPQMLRVVRDGNRNPTLDSEVDPPSDGQIAGILVSTGHNDPTEIWALPSPSDSGCSIGYVGTGGTWQMLWATQHPQRTSYGLLSYNENNADGYCGLHPMAIWNLSPSAFPDWNDYYQGEPLAMWEPWPFAVFIWKDGDELLSDNEDVFEDCLCSDTFFSDLTVYQDGKDEENLDKYVICFLRWSKSGNAFPQGADLFKDIETGLTLKQPINKNNNPQIHRDLRANSHPYYCTMTVIVKADGDIKSVTLTESLIGFNDTVRAAGRYVDGVFTPYGKKVDSDFHSTIPPIDGAIELAMGPSFCLHNRATSATREAIAGITSADTHTLNTIAYPDDVANANLCGGSKTTGKHQQIIIPLKPRDIDPQHLSILGDLVFASTMGAMDNDVHHTDWYSGQGTSNSHTWLEDRIYKGCLATGTITYPMLIKKQGAVYEVTPMIGTGNPIFGKEFCKWAARVDTINITTNKEENWLVWSKQTIDYRGVSPATEEKFSIVANNFFDYTSGVPAEINLTGNNTYINGVLSDAYAITPKSTNDAWVYYCYSDLENHSRLAKTSLIDPSLAANHLDVSGSHFYDQFIVDQKYIYALCKDCGILDVISIVDLTIKKTITVNWNSMSTATSGGIVGRRDQVGNPNNQGVKTTVDYYKYMTVSP
jgi:hypothetical protein